jgi:phospholipid/cholesterol/gamma-HCH transport system substrate-binding protein
MTDVGQAEPTRPNMLRPLAGLGSVLVVIGIVAVAVTLFRGGFTGGIPVTVMSQRAGLVMNPDAKVRMLGVEVGKVSSIEELPDGSAALHLSMNPSQLHKIPANVLVDIASTTVFGAKFVQLLPPSDPSPQAMYAGQVLDAARVTVEINTVFQQLSSVLAQLDPAKLNETLGVVARALSGRGEKFGQALADFDVALAKLDPALPALSHDLSVAPAVVNTYADAAPDLLTIAANGTRLSTTLVDQQHNLDALLLGVTGLADVGDQFLSDNRVALGDVLHLLVPTTQLTDEYNPALTCSLVGFADLGSVQALNAAGVTQSVNFLMGHERYRYPGDLPKVAAKGGPHCEVLPVKYQTHPKYVLADVGTNPWKYGNQGLLWNTDAIKQFLFGPVDGPPRNVAQIGQPG